MLRLKALRPIFLISLLIAVVLPLYDLLIIHPSYQDQLERDTEEESVRNVGHLLRFLEIENVPLQRGMVSPEVFRKADALHRDSEFLKLRFFTPDGEILFSTDHGEIGQVNRKPYFTRVVAAGNVYSKVVRSDGRTAEGVLASSDVVETYVPILLNGKFAGAVEIYADITARRERIEALSRRSTTTLLLLSVTLFALFSFALLQARRSFLALETAESALREANSELEARVASRTEELCRANRQLTAEVAERTRAQEDLSRALSRLEDDKEKIDAILRAVAEGLILTDRDGHIVLMNPAAERLLGLRSQVVAGRLLAELTAGVLPRDLLPLLQEDGRGGDLVLPGREGFSTRVLLVGTRAITDRWGRRLGNLTVLHDRTREREIEKMKNEFVSMAAHELQTPLTAIIGYSELLTEEEDERFSAEDRIEFLSYIREKAEALSRIVNDLLDVSRAETGGAPLLEKSSFRVATLMGNLVAQYRLRFPNHSFELTTDDPRAELIADRDRITQVLENLLSNAVKYSSGGLVRVTGERVAEGYRISVNDQGIGMTAEQRSRIFDKFYRADGSNTAVPGIGLGMSVARYLVESHGGTIDVESEPGIGTSVRFVLPLTGDTASEILPRYA